MFLWLFVCSQGNFNSDNCLVAVRAHPRIRVRIRWSSCRLAAQQRQPIGSGQCHSGAVGARGARWERGAGGWVYAGELAVAFVQRRVGCAAQGRTMDYGPFGFLEKYDPAWNMWSGRSPPPPPHAVPSSQARLC